MKNMPVVSFIVPVYKAEQYICECLNSIKQQTFVNWECLLIDDGSPDNSGLICEEYARQDPRFKVFHEKNGGVSKARNIGLKNMLGEWVMFVDSDDVIDKNAVEVCLNYVEKNDLDALQFSYVCEQKDLGNDDGVKTDVLKLSDFIKTKKLLVTVWGNLFKTSIIRNINLFFDEYLKLAEDQLFVFEYMNYVKRIQRIEKKIYFYRNNLDGATNNSKSEDMAYSLKILSDYKKDNQQWSAYVDRINLIFLLKLIYNNEVNSFVIKKYIEKAKISNVQLVGFGLPLLFAYVCKINRTLAIMLVRFRFFFK